MINKVLPSGLKIEDLKMGQGAKAQKGRSIGITYTIADESGKVLGTNKGKEMLSFIVGETNSVIKGLNIGVQGMALGGERKLVIPKTFGDAKEGLQPALPKGENAVVTVKLEKVQSK